MVDGVDGMDRMDAMDRPERVGAVHAVHPVHEVHVVQRVSHPRRSPIPQLHFRRPGGYNASASGFHGLRGV